MASGVPPIQGPNPLEPVKPSGPKKVTGSEGSKDFGPAAVYVPSARQGADAGIVPIQQLLRKSAAGAGADEANRDQRQKAELVGLANRDAARGPRGLGDLRAISAVLAGLVTSRQI